MSLALVVLVAGAVFLKPWVIITIQTKKVARRFAL